MEKSPGDTPTLASKDMEACTPSTTPFEEGKGEF